MEIDLPRPCYGSQILEIFAQAATFEIYPHKRWDAVEIVENEGVVGIPLFVRKGAVFKKKGIDIIMSTRKRRYGFFGKLAWKPEETPIIRLSPLELSATYQAVEVLVEHVVTKQRGTCIVRDPQDPHFAEFLPHYEATLKRFLSKVVHDEHVYA